MNAIIDKIIPVHEAIGPTHGEPATARWKGEGFGDWRCSWCDEVVSGRPRTCPCCKSGMSNPDDEEKDG